MCIYIYGWVRVRETVGAPVCRRRELRCVSEASAQTARKWLVSYQEWQATGLGFEKPATDYMHSLCLFWLSCISWLFFCFK